MSLAVISTLSACVEAPEFPSTPKIALNNLIFKEVGSNSDPDSLIVFVDFEDGDGDLGLEPSEILPPYNQKNYFNNKSGQLINFSTDIVSVADLIVFSNRSTIDTLPDFVGDAICLNWDDNPEIEVITRLPDGSDSTFQLQDTVYFQFNPRHHNFLIDFFIERGGEFELFDWRLEIDCSTDFNGRFPSLNEDNESRALEGTIKYGMTSVGFKSIFREDRLKLRMTVIDRSGKYSNTIETEPFRLSDID